jgi:hypothetical protein
MANYKVTYEIEVGADSALDAAMQVEHMMLEQMMQNPSFRPYFTVTSSTETVDIDLEELEVTE